MPLPYQEMVCWPFIKLLSNFFLITQEIYDKTLTEFFKNKLGIVQYNAALVITGEIKGTLLDRIYREFGLESLAKRK